MLNRKNSGVNGVELAKRWRQRRSTRKIAELTAFNRKKSSVNSVELEK